MDLKEGGDPGASGQTFTHISAIQESQLELLRWWSGPRRAENRKLASNEDRKRIHAFLDSVKRAGGSIQFPLERRTAQAILDYWTTELITAHDPDFIDQSSIALDPYDPSKAPELSDQTSPYCGLNAFSEANRQTFFGREHAVEDLLSKVVARKLTIVSGLSGSGKSSLVLAGLVPRLRQAVAVSYDVLDPIVPGRRPVEALRRTISQPKRPDSPTQRLREVLVIDQFEELFTLDTPIDERNAFLDLVTTFAQQNLVVICIREDYVEALKRSTPTRPWATDREAYYSLPPMTPRELKDAIERPAERVGLRFAPEVTEALVKEVVGEPAALPLLQFTLQELWNNRDRNLITPAVYAKVGCPREALQRVADRTLKDLRLVENESIAERIFLKLVTPRTEHEFLRNSRTREFLTEQEVNPRAVDNALDRFVAAGLLRKQPISDEVRDDDRFDVAHEALIRNWPWLVDKLNSGWRNKEQRFRLQMAATMYIDSGGRADYLLKGEKLDEARQHEGASSEIRELVNASDAAAERERTAAVKIRRIRIVAGIIMVAILLWAALATLIFPYFQEQSTRKLLAQIKSSQVSLSSPEANNQQRIEALRFLLDNNAARFLFLSDGKASDDEFVKLRQGTLEDATFTDARSTGVQFTGTTFKRVSFTGASLPLAGFSQTMLTDVSFTKSDLNRARFDDAMLRKTNFKQTQLRQSTFDRTLFCGEVTFVVSDVRGASFRNVKFDKVPRFVGTAWWLAVGWSIDDVKMLAQQSPGVDYMFTKVYTTELAERDKQISAANSPLQRAEALNRKAWHQVTWGLSLADAEKASRESIAILREYVSADYSVSRFGDVKLDELLGNLVGIYLDTLAYILMQNKKYGDAIPLLKEAMEKTSDDKEIQFHYALALFADGKMQDAKDQLFVAVETKKYDPSHELYLLLEVVEKDEFRGWLDAMLAKDVKESNGTRRECAADAPSPQDGRPSGG